jgi:hypothetical protein
MERTAFDDYQETADAVSLLRSFNRGCAPEYVCAMDYDSPCEIRARAFQTLSNKLVEIMFRFTRADYLRASER